MLDKDIKEMFFKKNAEIIKNKLVLDLNNNIDSFVATIENIIYLEFGIHKEKIISVIDNNKEKKELEKLLKDFQDYFNKVVFDLISFKKNECNSFIENLDLDKRMDEYKKKLNETTISINDNLLEKIKKYIDDNLISKLIFKDWYLYNDTKINFYLNDKLGDDIYNKIISQLKDRDTIIYNNAKESYEKYLALNNNFK